MSDQRAWRGPARGAAIGLGTGVVVVLARGAGLLEGWVGVVVMLVGLLAVPTSRELSRRALLTGCLVVGWVPLAWWAPLPWSGVGHVTVLMAGVLGGVVGWVFAGDPRIRIAVLVPRIRAVDALPLLAAATAALVVRPWLTVASADGAVTMLLKGWDHSAHYDIVRMIREHGSVVGALGPAPLGDTWSYASYPQGFHTIAAAVMELQVGAEPLEQSAEVLVYARVLGILMVFGAGMLAAGLCAVPFLRRRPWAALPAVVLAVGGLVLGPGGYLLTNGFPNFTLAVVLLASVVLLALPLDRVSSPVHLAAIGGALVGVAHGWVLLLSLALPAAAVVLLPLRRSRFAGSPARWGVCGLILLATAFGTGTAVLMVVGEPILEVLTVSGGITAPPVAFLVAPAVVAVVACLVTAWRPPWAGARRRTDIRVVATAAVPLIGLAGSGAIAAVQLRAGVPLGYYFWKYALGLAVLSVVVVAVAVARLVPPRIHRGSTTTWVASVAVSVALTQVFGVTVVGDAAWKSPALRARVRLFEAAEQPTVVAGYLWAATAVDPGHVSRVVLLTADADPAIHSAMVGQWYNAVTGRWTDQANEALLFLFGLTATVPDRAAVTAAVLTADPKAVVVVSPADWSDVVTLVPEPLRARVVTW